jgi:PAS domain-containing protein
MRQSGIDVLRGPGCGAGGRVIIFRVAADEPAEELDLLRQMLDALSDCVVICKYDVEEDDAACLWCNRATMLATGLTREEIIGSPPRRLLPVPGDLEDRATRRRLFDAVRAAGFIEERRPLSDPMMPKEATLRIRVHSLGRYSDLYVLQTELVVAGSKPPPG